MSTLTAVLKRPHDEGGYISNERVGEEEATAADSACRADHSLRCGSVNGGILPACEEVKRRYDLDGARGRTGYSAAAFFCGRLE